MEPERKIEKLLRAYAKNRRAGAGDPLTLPPATRRLLQGEVARRKPTPDDEEEASLSLWELLRQRWALLAGFALVMFFGAALLLPALSKSKTKAQSFTAVSNLKQIGVAAQMVAYENDGRLPPSLDALKKELGSEQVLTDPEAGKPFIYVAGGKNLASLSSNAVLAYSPAERPDRAVLFADGRVEVVNGARLAELTGAGSSPLLAANEPPGRPPSTAPDARKDVAGQASTAANPLELRPAAPALHPASGGKLAANAPAAAPASLDQPAMTPGAAADDAKSRAETFPSATAARQGAATGVQNSFKNLAVPAPAAAVLAKFQVQQTGNAIRVVDADGSVYDGSLAPEGGLAQTAPAPAEMARQKSAVNREEPPTAQNVSFRVSGTNLTLQQNVVFAGMVLANSNAVTPGQLSNARNANVGGVGVGGQLPWANARIAGTAVVSDTNRIEINAVPQSP